MEKAKRRAIARLPTKQALQSARDSCAHAARNAAPLAYILGLAGSRLEHASSCRDGQQTRWRQLEATRDISATTDSLTDIARCIASAANAIAIISDLLCRYRGVGPNQQAKSDRLYRAACRTEKSAAELTRFAGDLAAELTGQLSAIEKLWDEYAARRNRPHGDDVEELDPYPEGDLSDDYVAD